MDLLSAVSETAIITLRARTIESKKQKPILHDEVSAICLERIGLLLPEETRKRLFSGKMSPALARHLALRARKYDCYAIDFLARHSDGLAVSLGSGFDTRYWRVSDQPWKYVEVDLPNVIKAKREILQGRLEYMTIGCSVLEDQWIEEVLAIQNRHVLFLAEGLFMYLPQKEVEALFGKLAESFSDSCIVFETVSKRYTQGLWKKMVELKLRQSGATAGSAYQFGVNNGKEVESFGRNIKLVEEWSYFEDPDIEPKILRFMGRLKFFTRTQWTIKATIG